MRWFRGLFASRQRTASAAVVVTGAAGMLVLALSAAGTPGTQAELNDGGVWVTNVAGGEYSRFIKAIRQQDSPGGLDSRDFDLVQSGARVLVLEPGTNAMRVVDPASTLASPPISLPGSRSTVALGGQEGQERVVVVDPVSGNYWIMPFDQVTGITPASKPTGVAGAGAVATVNSAGTVLIASASTGELVTAQLQDGEVSAESTALPASFRSSPDGAEADLEVSAVGPDAVVLNRTSGAVWTPRGESTVGPVDGLHLQQPGPQSDQIVIASRQGLLQVPAAGGTPQAVGERVSASSDPPAPVRMGGCVYGAFKTATSVLQVKSCGDAAVVQPLQSSSGRALPPGDAPSLTYRVNRGLVVLNDTQGGAIWDPDDEELRRLDSWADLAALKQLEKESEETDDTVAEQECRDSGRRNSTPTVKDDQAGARPGRPVVIDVLANDSDRDCDVLALADPAELPEAKGKVQLVSGGRKLQFTAGDGASGSTVSFRYAVTDGHKGGSAQGTVKVRVGASDRANRAPEGRRARTVVEQGKSVAYNVLSDFTDPDGDPLFLKSAVVDPANGTVRYTGDGTVTYKDGGTTIGRVAIDLVVSDGQSEAKGVLEVRVRPEGNMAPTARSDYARTPAGQAVEVFPLANDSDPNQDDLRLLPATGADADRLHVRTDTSRGRVLVPAAEAGSYLLGYVVSDGVKETTGRIRVDVTERSANGAPVAMVDNAEVRVGSTTTVDVLANDFDPDGDVMITTQAWSGAASSVKAVVVDHRRLAIELRRSLDEPVMVTYGVSDGRAGGTGLVIVREIPEGAVQPQAVEDSVRARPGGHITIPVLANDVDPVGEGLRLSQRLDEPSAGQARVNGSVIRYDAGADTGTVRFSYRISDADGHNAIGRVTVRVAEPRSNTSPDLPSVQARVMAGGQAAVLLPLVGSDPNGDQVFVESVTSSEFGNEADILPGSADTLLYRATRSRVGTDVVEYTACDLADDEACAKGVVRVGVLPAGRNMPPIAMGDAVVVRPGRDVAVDVVANDSDPDGDTLALADGSVVPGTGIEAGARDGLVVFTAPAEGDYRVDYAVTDGTNEPATGELSVRVSDDAPLQAPTARDDAVVRGALQQGDVATVDVLANDRDPDGSPEDLSVELLEGSSGASVAGGSVEVKLGPEARVIPYAAVDRDGNRGYAYILVPPVKGMEPRLVSPLPQLSVDAGEPLEIDLSTVVVDPDNGPDPLSLVPDGSTANPASTSDLVSGKSTLTYTPAKDVDDDQATLSISVTDGMFTRTFQIPVRIVIPNRPPEFVDVAEDVEKGAEKPLVIRLQSSVTDPDTADRARPATFSGLVHSGSSEITGDLTEDGVLSVSASGNATIGSTATFAFTVTDAEGASTQGEGVVTVVPTRKEPPEALPDTIDRLDAGETVVRDVLANDFDPFARGENAGLKIADVQTVSGGVTARVEGERSIAVSAATDFAGTARIQYTVTDFVGRTADGLLEANVWGLPSTPGTPTEVKDSTTATTVRLTWGASEPNVHSSDPDATRVTYLVSYDGGSQECPDTECTIDGLTSGVAYRFRVTARNEVGDSPASAASAPMTPDALPAAPVLKSPSGTDPFGDGSVALAWDQPSFEGSRILKYELQVTPGERTVDVGASARSTTVTGLTNGVTYRFVLTAVNAKGSASSDAYEEMPTALPGAPGTPQASPDEGPAGQAIDVTWGAADDGGDDAMTYTVVLYQGSTVVSTKKDVASTSIQLSGENGRTYRVGVTAVNRKGSGAEAKSDAVTPIGAPGAVTGLKATATGANTEVQLAFSAPSETGGVAASSLTYDVDWGAGWRTLGSDKKVTGLENGLERTINVRADNGTKTGDSASVSATPFGPVLAPSAGASASGQSITFTWTAAANGRPISVTISIDGGAAEPVGTTGSTVRTFSDYNTAHSIRVTATAENGSESATASAQTGPPPSSVRVSKGSRKNIATCTSTACAYVVVEIFNFPPNQCWMPLLDNSKDGQWAASDTRQICANSSGYGIDSNWYVYGWPGYEVWATVGGVRSLNFRW